MTSIRAEVGDITAKYYADAVVNAANEVVNAGFLHDQISFLGMSEVIEQTMQHCSFLTKPTLEDYMETDAEARRVASELMNKKNNYLLKNI